MHTAETPSCASFKRSNCMVPIKLESNHEVLDPAASTTAGGNTTTPFCKGFTFFALDSAANLSDFAFVIKTGFHKIGETFELGTCRTKRVMIRWNARSAFPTHRACRELQVISRLRHQGCRLGHGH